MPGSPQSAILKRDLEARLASRIPAALSPQPQQAPRLLPTGIPELEAVLGGGLPLGGITEFTGQASSGRTSLALSVLASASGESACAYIDTSDSLDPRSAAAAGVRLGNLLWVRLSAAASNPSPRPRPIPKPAINGSIGKTRETVQQNCGGPHPRSETRGLDRALEAMLAHKAEARSERSEGTPSHPNRKLTLASAPQDQIDYEHFNARRADETDPLRQLDRRAADHARQRAHALIPAPSKAKETHQPWNRLEKAIRATDQVLQSGGFRVVVLDLASVPPEQALRIPAATWFRFRRAAHESDAILLLLTQEPCARSSALCVLDCSAVAPRLTGNVVLSGFTHSAEVARQRVSNSFARKAPGRVTAWETSTHWMRVNGR